MNDNNPPQADLGLQARCEHSKYGHAFGQDDCNNQGTTAVMPVAVTVAEFCRLCSIGKTTAWALIRDDKVEVRRIGSRTLVLTRSIAKLLELDAAD